MTTFAIPHRHTSSTAFGQQAHIRAMRILLEEKGVHVDSLVQVEGRPGTFKVHRIDQFQRITLATTSGVVLRDSVSPRTLTLVE